MKHEIVTVTPEVASVWLDQNTNNRPLNKKRVTNLANVIARGEWELNGDSIRFSESGVLLDGQHRLAAIVEADSPVQTMVVTGLKDSVFDVIDRGATRTVGDVLSMRGEKNYNALAAATRLYYTWSMTGNPFHGSPDKMPTARQIEATVDANPGLRRSVQNAQSSAWIRKNITTRMAAFCFYVFEKSDLSDSLESFYDTLDTGAATMKRDPAIVLRDMIMEDKSTSNKRKMADKYKCALIFKAFKKHALGEQVRFLRVRTTGDRKETELYSLPMSGGQ